MLLALVAVLGMCQRLDPPPRVSYVGDEIAVRASDVNARPVVGILVTVRDPEGVFAEVGRTDADGVVRFVSLRHGPHEFHADFPSGPRVIAVHNVVERPTRWLYAIVLTPLGLLLIVWNFRKLRRGP